MTKKTYPSEAQDRFIVRLPEGMRDRIAQAARKNGRSMNAEIVQHLMMLYPPPPSIAQLLKEIDMFLEWAKRAPDSRNMSHLYSSLKGFREQLLEQAQTDVAPNQPLQEHLKQVVDKAAGLKRHVQDLARKSERYGVIADVYTEQADRAARRKGKRS